METQQTISRWAQQTFGEPGSNFRVVVRATEEMAELLKALATQQTNDKILEEAADVAIVMYRYAERLRVQISTSCFPANRSRYAAEDLAAQANIRLAEIIEMLAICDDNRYTSYCINQLYWFLEQICVKLQSNLQKQVDAKMVINRERKWRLDESGHGYHVKEEIKGARS